MCHFLPVYHLGIAFLGRVKGQNITLILFFRHQLRVKIRFERKRLDRITFDKRWVHAASLVVRKGATLKSPFPPFPGHGCIGLSLPGPHPGKLSIQLFPLLPLVSSVTCHRSRHLVSKDLPAHFFFSPVSYDPSPIFAKDLCFHIFCLMLSLWPVPLP